MRSARIAALAAAALLGTAGTATAASVQLSYIGQSIIPTGTQYAGTTVGGLSGIDALGGGQFAIISDDRSQINPARFYTATIDVSQFNANGVNSGVTLTGVTTLLDPSGVSYPALSIDPEAIRRLPNGNYLFTSEGDVNLGIDAFIRETTAAGAHVSGYTIPANVQQTGPAGTTGIRQNLAFESLTLDGGTAYTATENALRQDGPASTLTTASPARIIAFDAATGATGAHYVYEVAPVVLAPNPANAFATNGLVELLALGGGKFIAVERSFSVGAVGTAGNTGNSIKLFEIDLAGATDVSGLASLNGQSYTPVSKTLILDLATLDIPLDNIEGISFGETLPSGKRSLILVSDNNFSPTQFTQFLAFEATVPEPATWAMLITGFGLVGTTLRRRRSQSNAACRLQSA